MHTCSHHHHEHNHPQDENKINIILKEIFDAHFLEHILVSLAVVILWWAHGSLATITLIPSIFYIVIGGLHTISHLYPDYKEWMKNNKDRIDNLNKNKFFLYIKERKNAILQTLFSTGVFPEIITGIATIILFAAFLNPLGIASILGIAAAILIGTSAICKAVEIVAHIRSTNKDETEVEATIAEDTSSDCTHDNCQEGVSLRKEPDFRITEQELQELQYWRLRLTSKDRLATNAEKSTFHVGESSGETKEDVAEVNPLEPILFTTGTADTALKFYTNNKEEVSTHIGSISKIRSLNVIENHIKV